MMIERIVEKQYAELLVNREISVGEFLEHLKYGDINPIDSVKYMHVNIYISEIKQEEAK